MNDTLRGWITGDCFGIITCGCKGIISTGSDCKGIIIPW